MEPNLTKKEIIGRQYIHVFKSLSDSSTFVQVCSEKEYTDLASGGQPQKEGYVWLHSSDYPKVDTPSGFLGANEYMTIGNDAVIKVDSPDPLKTIEIEKDRIVNDVITPEGLAEIELIWR